MKIVLPIDGSDCSMRTLKWATEIFEPRTTEFLLLMVIPPDSDLNAMEYDIADASAILKQACYMLEGKGYLVKRGQYAIGEPVDCICQLAEEENVDLVAIGSHGRTGLSKLLLGSVSIAVLERCKRPVAIFRNVEVLLNKSEHFLSNTLF